MSDRGLCSGALAPISCILLVACAGTAGGAELDPVRLREEWKLLSESLETLGFTSVESVDERITGKRREEPHQFLWGSGGRAALIVDVFESQGRRRVFDLREDGRFRYQLIHPRHAPDEVTTLQISRQRSTGARFEGMMPRGLWAIMPFGRSYHRLLESGGSLRRIDDPPGLLLEAREGDLSLEANLSRDDGVPEEVRLSSDRGTLRLRVTKREVIHDRWLPVAGEGEERELGSDGSLSRNRRFRYQLGNLAINSIVPAA